MRLYAVTTSGLARLTEAGSDWNVKWLRRDGRAQCVALDPHDASVLYLGTRGGGLWKSIDGGSTWSALELPEPDVFSVAISPADGAVYAGTEPSRLFKSTDGGASWDELEGLQDIPSRSSWSYPPRPHTSHVRAIAPHPTRADVLLAGIELGGLMVSRDGGVSWSDHRPGAVKDVHALAWHPHDPQRAYEAGGGGAAYSIDGGLTWRPSDAGRDRHYTWGLAVHPADADTWFVSASPGPRHAHSDGNAQAAIYRRRGEEPWELVGSGLPRPLDSFPYALLHTGDRLFAGLRDGRVWRSNDNGASWAELSTRGAPLVQIMALSAG